MKKRSEISIKVRFSAYCSFIVCPIGIDDQKLLLFDDFQCIDEGTLMGKVSKEVIKEMRKAN